MGTPPPPPQIELQRLRAVGDKALVQLKARERAGRAERYVARVRVGGAPPQREFSSARRADGRKLVHRLRRRGLLLLGTYCGAQQQNELGEAWQEGKKQQRLWEGHPPAWVFDYAGSQKLGFREYFFRNGKDTNFWFV